MPEKHSGLGMLLTSTDPSRRTDTYTDPATGEVLPNSVTDSASEELAIDRLAKVIDITSINPR